MIGGVAKHLLSLLCGVLHYEITGKLQVYIYEME